MRKSIIILLTSSLSLVLVLGACTPKPKAVSVEDFFKTNTVTVIANGSIGGGTDFAARLFASYWAEVTGGPAMPVRVMPGGGGIEGLNYVFNAEPDGLTIGDTHHPSDLAAPQLLDTPGPDFDPREFSYMGFFGGDPSIFFLSADSPYETLDDLKNAGKLVFGATNPGSMGSVSTIVGVEALGLTADVVHGYEGSELGLGAKRGEIAGFGFEASSGGVMVDKGLSKPFVSLTFERTEWYPDTPAITELVDLTPAQEDMIVFVEALIAGKSFYAPPGISAEKLTYLRSTFDTITSMKPFVKQAKTRWKIWSTPLTGAQLQTDVERVLGMPPEKVTAVRALFAKYIK